ncbi:MAG: hypothetical protein ABJA62_06730 [Luteimonas sp.]
MFCPAAMAWGDMATWFAGLSTAFLGLQTYRLSRHVKRDEETLRRRTAWSMAAILASDAARTHSIAKNFADQADRVLKNRDVVELQVLIETVRRMPETLPDVALRSNPSLAFLPGDVIVAAHYYYDQASAMAHNLSLIKGASIEGRRGNALDPHFTLVEGIRDYLRGLEEAALTTKLRMYKYLESSEASGNPTKY